jgi:predicted small secreted protein
MKKTLLIVVLVWLLIGFAGCHTISGMGEDLSDLGHGIANLF